MPKAEDLKGKDFVNDIALSATLLTTVLFFGILYRKALTRDF